MLRKIRRQMNKALTGLALKESEKSVLKLEALENRTLLDVAGYWSELGYRSASGGGVSWDVANDVGQTQMVTTTDGDSVVFWIDGNFNDSVTMDVSSDPVMGTYNFYGTIHARQYAGEDLGWWDLSYGSGDIAITRGGQIDVAAGPNGSIVLAGVDDSQQAFVMLWNGYDWQNITTANIGRDYASTVNPIMTQVQVNEEAEDAEGTEVDETEIVTEVLVADVSSPSVAVNDAGEIFVSYTVMHPNSNQYEVVVKKYGYTYSDGNVLGAPLPNDRGWVELTSTEVGLIGATNNQQTAGVSNSTGNSFDSSITVDESGRPVVVWTEAYKSNNTEIFIKRWDGNSWEEIGENSASVNPADDNSGISSNSYQDIQPDIAINDDGDIIVSWVCWHNWSNYQTNGQAGIYVKYLPGDDLDGAWRGYNFMADGSNVSSDSGAGIAQGNGVPENRAGLGWYYNPQIVLDSAGSPAISW
ncbi:MAG: hypothetical protein JXM68_06375, partial [Sedimentisphaerales bacterium]|nr:hypothetical protein [Sedimentisphaerales bacterium]